MIKLSESYYQLIEGVDTRQVIPVAKREKNYTKYGEIELFPGKQYKLPEDEIFRHSLKAYEIEKVKTDRLVHKLKSLGIPYEVRGCRVCGGTSQKVYYSPVEVIIDGET